MKAIIPMSDEVHVEVHGEPSEIAELLHGLAETFAGVTKIAVQVRPVALPAPETADNIAKKTTRRTPQKRTPKAPGSSGISPTPESKKPEPVGKPSRTCGCGPYGKHRKTCDLKPPAPPKAQSMRTGPAVVARPGMCAVCGNHPRSQAHADACNGGVRPGGHVAKKPAAPPPPVRRREVAPLPPAEQIYELPADEVMDFGDEGRLAPMQVPGEVHIHMFALPPHDPEQRQVVGQCTGCAANRRFWERAA